MDQNKEKEARAVIEKFLKASHRLERTAKLNLPTKLLKQVSDQAKTATEIFEKLLQDARENKKSMQIIQGLVEEIKESIENDYFIGDFLEDQRVHIYQEFLYEIFTELTQRDPRVLNEEDALDILGSSGDADVVEAVFALLTRVRADLHQTLTKIMSKKRPVRKRK